MRRKRDILILISSILLIFIYIPHLLLYFLGNKKTKNNINEDIERNKWAIELKLNHFFYFLFLLHSNSFFRSLFYYRIGPLYSLFFRWIRPGCPTFKISYLTTIKGGLRLVHPFSSIIYAKNIGENFTINCNSVIGSKDGSLLECPSFGNNVTLGANVCIIGNIKIGNNVIIGAGSIVINSIPDNVIIAGNPAKIIKTLKDKQADSYPLAKTLDREG